MIDVVESDARDCGGGMEATVRNNQHEVGFKSFYKNAELRGGPGACDDAYSCLDWRDGPRIIRWTLLAAVTPLALSVLI
jgi:hypothetical protein